MKRFKPSEDDYLRANYLYKTLNELGAHLNRPFGSIAGRLRLLNLVIPQQLKNERVSRGLKIGHSLVETRFKKGFIPHNKGKKMPPDVYEKCSKTMFKKGQFPHNTKYDGATRITKDGYIEERVSPGCYKLKHRIVWEQVHGPIPHGCCVKFKDGNPQNVAIDNLYMVTRSQNMETNTIQRYPDDLKKAIHKYYKLKKTIQNEANKY